ncbi:MAG: phosphocholine cytidylyltransferase family protein [Candidatus Hydrogenedentes bacterium]|nr:phosphocholine cytidylyltransferase family protein [Candidatus Hydrogenedentota bacterium]
MKAVIIGAGRGQRLMPHTADAPKCFAEVQGKRILDWGIEALASAGLDDFVFIGGYRIEMVRENYPHFTFCHNADWANNNILESLMHAADHMDDGFVCAYSDILYTPEIIQQLVTSPHDMTLVSDTDWRARYVQRTEHPEDDGEKIAVNGSARVAAINRTMPSEAAHGEYIGVARFTPRGAAAIRKYYEDARAKYGDGPFLAAKTFRKAYLIDLFQHMIEAGEAFHALATPGGYMEIDTNQDFKIAREEWGI